MPEKPKECSTCTHWRPFELVEREKRFDGVKHQYENFNHWYEMVMKHAEGRRLHVLQNKLGLCNAAVDKGTMVVDGELFDGLRTAPAHSCSMHTFPS